MLCYYIYFKFQKFKLPIGVLYIYDGHSFIKLLAHLNQSLKDSPPNRRKKLRL